MERGEGRKGTDKERGTNDETRSLNGNSVRERDSERDSSRKNFHEGLERRETTVLEKVFCSCRKLGFSSQHPF